MSMHDRSRVPESHTTSPTPERSLRAGGGATARDLPARPSHELPQEAPREVKEALAVQLKVSAATQYGFERDPFGVGPVQCERAPGASPSPDDTLAIAADGVAGGSSSLPHAQAIQTSFGRHDVSGIEAHVGGRAANAADAMGATAYATGSRVAFKQAPDLHTAAHEAAHVVQQRGGVQLKGGVGESGDVYEQHADAVADRVVRGESAESLLDTHAGTQSPRPAVQHRADGAKGLAPSVDRMAPRTPERDAPRRLDDLERVTQRMREALPGMMTTHGKATLKRLAVQGRAVRDALADMQRAGLLSAQDLEDRFVEARTHFENIDAKLPPSDTPTIVEPVDEPVGAGMGIPIIDEGFYCEREGHGDILQCSLSPDARRLLRSDLKDRVGLAHQNFAIAVTLKHVEEMTRSTNNWGFMAELFFGVASLAVGSALMEIGKRATRLPRTKLPGVDPSSMVTIEEMPMDGMNPDHVLLGWKQMSAGIRNSVRSSVNNPAPEKTGRQAFLDALLHSAGQMSQTIGEQAMVVLNDQEAVALLFAYHIDLHPTSMYKQRVDELMARFEAQNIDDVGKDLDHDFGRREIVQLKYRGRLRRAMVAKDDAEPVDWAKRPPRFISWVDSAFGEYADQVQRARAGDVDVVELDPWDPMKKSPASPIDGGISDEVINWMRAVNKEDR